ncbi:MAG TPA: hypothetical protein VFV67_09270 [Actinophytocola sp.]|uniref:hypothetical protein n=1 Tax=Actinophytocola sp. TaxID=1872138 RepID=UPI002DBA7D66|nr:hypothetical protein [Actinophytocola sp.]HEU5470831.1 hypothetical protein [Actinophytocola sp.]
MTGWQGNEGGGHGGGWNPQQPDPYGGQYGGGTPGQYGGGQYGADPYAQQQYGGTDPYGQQQYGGVDPYGGNPYGPQTQAYPAYQTGFGPPEPPKRNRWPIIVSVVAIVAAVGTVVTIVLMNRGSDDPSPTAGGQTSSSRPPATSRSAPGSSRRLPPATRAPDAKDGWVAIPLPGGASYQVPEDWKPDGRSQPSGLGVDFHQRALFGSYDCGGSNYFRGFSAAGEVSSKSGAELDVNKTVTDFATSFANEYYRNPKLDTPQPKPTTVDGKDAATMTIKLTVTPNNAECEATSGEVAIVGVGIEEGGKLAAVRMLVVVNDLAGGPASPPGLPDPLAEEILTTLKLG